jgi:hypothetical protein
MIAGKKGSVESDEDKAQECDWDASQKKQRENKKFL